MANPTDIVTLADVKTHLRYPSTDVNDDIALQGFISAADDVIRQECGDVIPRHYDEYHDGGNYWIYLRHRPVISVENVEEGWGWWNYELDYQQVNTQPAGDMFAYSVDSPEIGGITRRSAGNVQIPFVPGTKNIRVWYTAGRLPIPPVIRLAALELIAHWWQGSQFRASANGNTQNGYDATEGERYDRGNEQGVVGINYGLPFRVLELLKPYRHVPIIG